MSAEADTPRSADMTAEAECHLYRALGRSEPCPGVGCAFHRVPGIAGCAIKRWSPEIESDPVQAAWFLARRLESEQARAHREAVFGRVADAPENVHL